MKREQNILQSHILLYGNSDKGRFPRTFRIHQALKPGASAICYNASYQGSLEGTLKEIYPDWGNFIRNDDGQLFLDSNDKNELQKFTEYKRMYLKPYELFEKITEDFGIPFFEIYYSSKTKNEKETVYIWTPHPPVKTFHTICREIRRNPTADPKRDLNLILESLKTLVESIGKLHTMGLIHRDIKPANFGFATVNHRVQTQRISLFDINTICSIYEDFDTSLGTKGFIEPEIGLIDNLTDIYSIGATLFNAIIIDKDSQKEEQGINFDPNRRTTDRQFHRYIDRAVDSSELIKCFDSNLYFRLKATLKQILKKTLCRRAVRYKVCEEVLEELQKAIKYLNEGGKKIENDKEVIPTNENFAMNLMYHLYRYPLYEKVKKKAKRINLMLIGLGGFGRSFLDIALQAAQMPDKKINATVVVDNEEDKEAYLQERPELGSFFKIKGKRYGEEETYGKIKFITESISAQNVEYSRELLKPFFKKDKRLHYIFIAVGDDQKNMEIANMLREFADAADSDCIISFCREKKTEDTFDNIIPVYVNETITREPPYEEMERMAFNVHLTWEKNLNIDYGKIKSNFRDKYNHTSSILNVLSLKYKLYGVGIDLSRMSFLEAARAFDKFIKENPQEKDTLAYLEHRRWITEKICDGYKRLTDLEYCVKGSTRNEGEKLHICIARSRPENKLDKWSREQWDTGDDFAGLDELEKMSVQLHRKYMEHVEGAKKLNLISGENTSSIINLIDRDNECYIAFQEWLTCIKDIWNGSIKQIKQYSGLKNNFIDKVKQSKNLSDNIKRYIEDSINRFHTNFYPIYASQEYRNYKKDDIALIEKIPFILTYSSEFCMVIPYSEGNIDERFANVAVPTVVNPKWVIYLYYCHNIEEYQNLYQNLLYLGNYMSKKKLQTNVEFIVGYDGSFNIPYAIKIEKRFSDATGGLCKKARLYQAEREKEFIEKVKVYLKEKKNCFIEQNQTALSRLMSNTALFEEFPTYHFDSKKMLFSDLKGSEVLSYINVNTFLTGTDVIAMSLSTSKTSNKPEFYQDYQKLWNLYRKQPNVWKRMCGFLKSCSAEKDAVAKFELKNKKNKIPYLKKYIIPFICQKSVEKIMKELIQAGAIDEKSSIEVYTTDSCEVTIYDCYENDVQFKRLFSNAYKLMHAEQVNVYWDSSANAVQVKYDNLYVCNANCSELGSDEKSLMKELEEMNYLVNVYYPPSSRNSVVYFAYATHKIKDLLTVEGRILEIYTYHKAKEQAFDDIRVSFKVDWRNYISQNEFDGLLTKGFSTLLVECKAENKLREEVYTRLNSLREKFGINAQAVVISDSSNPRYEAENHNKAEVGRGYHIITISDPDEIDDIGNVLYKIITGTYQKEESD